MNRQLRVDSVPHLLQIELTYECNQNCVFCYNPERGQGVNLDNVDKIVENVSKGKIPHIYLMGGEPSVVGVNKLNEYIEKLSKNSSVTIVTNGYIRLEGISKKLACIAVPLHGYNSQTHEMVTRKKDGFAKTIDTIRYYVSEGIDVRCIIVLTGYNYNYIDKIMELAISLGMQSIFIDRYEDGGIGATNSKTLKLKASLKEFREALTKIIAVRNEEKIPKLKIGFGTAIPYCLDLRLFSEGLISSCGAGTTFCAVNNNGDLRLCNQSNTVYGNVLRERVSDIWKKNTLDSYRDLSWVDEPCLSCPILIDCQCGCRVDANCDKEFCIDYAIRDMDDIVRNNINIIKGHLFKFEADTYFRDLVNDKKKTKEKKIKLNRYVKCHTYDGQNLLVTQYSTVDIGNYEKEIIDYLLNNNVISEQQLIDKFSDFDKESIKEFICNLEVLGAVTSF